MVLDQINLTNANILLVDSYRNKVHSTMESVGQDVADKAPHFETRVGKRRWVERTKRGKGDA